MSNITKIPDLNQSILSIQAFKNQVDELALNCKAIKVVDESTLAICQQNLTKVSSLDKTIKDRVKEVRKPYNEILDSISDVGKPLSTPLEEATLHLKSQVLNWQNQQKKKQEILNYINGRVTDSLRKYFENSKTVRSCIDNINHINTHWPKPEKFGELNDLACELRDKYIKLINARMLAIEAGADIPDEPSIEAPKLVMVSQPKNIRRTWTHELVDITKVPLEWLKLDEDKVKEYLSENKETLEDGGVVNGVKFYRKESVTS